MSEWFNGIRQRLGARLDTLLGNRERHCPACGAQVSASARSCFMCGTILSAPRRKRPDPRTLMWPPRALIAKIKDRFQARSEARTTCPHCGAPVSRAAKVCSICEQPLGAGANRTKTVQPAIAPAKAEIAAERRKPRTVCPSCGARVSQDMELCPMCGVDLNRAALDQAVKSIEAQEQAAAQAESQERLVAYVIEQDGQTVCSCCGAIASETAEQCTICGADFVEVGDEPECALEPAAVPKAWYMRAWVWLIVILLLAAAVAGRAYLPDYLASRQALADRTPKPTQSPRKSAQKTLMPTQTQAPTVTSTPTPTLTPTPSPTPTLTPTRTPTPTPTPVIHVVKRGETLYGIARYYDVSVAELSRVNNVSTMSYVQPGDELIIPLEGRAPVATAPAGYVMHLVQSGERMSDLVRRYGISEERIREANEMEPDDALVPGSNLIIPFEPTPGPSLTVTPTSTPTPGLRYATPQLVYPPSDATFEGADTAIRLQWTSVGVLADDEWYALTLRYLGEQSGAQASKTTVYTRVTSWRVPEDWHPGDKAEESGFAWRVEVVRADHEDGPFTRISPPGQERTFEWK